MAAGTFTIGECGRSGVTVAVLANPVVVDDTIVIRWILTVASRATAAWPGQESGIGPVGVGNRIGRVLRVFGGIITDVEQLACLSVINLDVELRVAQGTAA